MTAGVVILDPSGEIVEWNSAAEQLLGLTGDQMRGRTSLHPEWRALAEDGAPLSGEHHPAAVCLRTGRPVLKMVMAVHTPRGDRRWLQVDAVPLRSDLGEQLGAAAIFEDITDQRAVASELAQAEERLSRAREAAAVGLWEWDLRTNELRHDDGITAIAGGVVESLEAWLDLVHPDDRLRMLEEVAAIVAGKPQIEVNYRAITFDGTEKHLLQRAVIVEWEGTTPVCMAGSTVDSTALHRITERVEHLLDSMTDAYLVLSHDFRLTYVNREAERVLGVERVDVVGMNLWELFPDAVDSEFAAQYLRAMGGVTVEFESYYAGLDAWFEVRAHPVQEGIAIYFRDVTERRLAGEERERLLRATEQAKEELSYAAAHDALTDLPNRAHSIGWLEEQLSRWSDSDPLAVLFIDLDRFKLVNDTHGHAEGDLLLIEAARRLRRLAPPDAMVARLGGDEFVIGLPGCSQAETVSFAERLLLAFSEPVVVGDRRLVVTASIGIAFAGGGATPVTLLRDADAALYRAKDEGRNRFGVFDDEIRQRVVARLHTEADLREALDNRQIYAEYQPIFDASSGAPISAEALARWNHAERGMIAPDEFISIAEESGLIVPLGEQMLDRAVRDHEQLAAALRTAELTVWVNVSARQLDDPGFARRLLDRVDALSLHGRLGIEITERVLASSAGAASMLARLAAAGVKVAIDDFGTGYSSLARLAAYPVDTIKIDRSFIATLGTDEGRRLVTAIIELTHAIGADACAEGVETADQLAAVVDLGVDKVSGYHLARPAGIEDLRLQRT